MCQLGDGAVESGPLTPVTQCVGLGERVVPGGGESEESGEPFLAKIFMAIRYRSTSELGMELGVLAGDLGLGCCIWY